MVENRIKSLLTQEFSPNGMVKDGIPIIVPKWNIYIFGNMMEVHKGLCMACEHSPEERCFTLIVPNPNQILPFLKLPYDALTHSNEPS